LQPEVSSWNHDIHEAYYVWWKILYVSTWYVLAGLVTILFLYIYYASTQFLWILCSSPVLPNSFQISSMLFTDSYITSFQCVIPLQNLNRKICSQFTFTWALVLYVNNSSYMRYTSKYLVAPWSLWNFSSETDYSIITLKPIYVSSSFSARLYKFVIPSFQSYTILLLLFHQGCTN